MNRRGFFGLIGKVLAVGVAMGVSPKLLEPVTKAVKEVRIGPGITSARVAWIPEMVSFEGGVCTVSYIGSDEKEHVQIIATQEGELVALRSEVSSVQAS